MEYEFTRKMMEWGAAHADFSVALSDGVLLLGLCIYVLTVHPLRVTGKYVRSLWHDLSPVIASVAIVEAVKYIFPMPRPFAVFGVDSLGFHLAPMESFPSGHSAAAAAFATTLFVHHRKLGRIVIWLVPVVMIGRVLVGAHFPHDVIAGAIIGCIVSLSMVKMGL